MKKYAAALAFMFVLAATSAATAGVTVSQPTSTTVSSPVRIVASANPTSGHRIDAMQIVVNGEKVYSTDNDSLDKSVSLKSGITNRVQVKAWDTGGTYMEKVLYLKVGSTSQSSTSSTSTSSGGGVSIQSPGSTSVSSPVHVVASASATSGHSISAMQIVVDGVKKYSTSNSSIDTYVSMSSGTNRMQVKAWDGGGNYFEKEMTLSVGTSTSSSSDSGSSSSSDASKYSNIDHMSGWSDCDECAGKNADGPSAYYWMKQGVSSPSIDGRSAQFHLGGSTPYANALWAKQLTSDGSKIRSMKHFVYDIYFYYKNSHAAQALEFNISQYIDGHGYIYGVQCNIRTGAGPQWDLSVPKDYSRPLTLENMTWKHTGIYCKPPTYKWNHLTVEFQRTSEDKVKFISLTFNGEKHYLNTTVSRRIAPSDWKGLNTHYQMDGNYQQEDYDTWVDKYSITYW